MKTKKNASCDAADESRRAIGRARRIVIKVGSRVLVRNSGRPNMTRIRSLVKDISDLTRKGLEVILVTSGAIGAGMEVLGMRKRPIRLPDLQMAAAVGQNRLMTRYEKLFANERRVIGQVLLTHDDLKHRARHLNARNTILNMLKNGIIPVVNENDAVAVDEIKFGDNDLLASLVVHLVDAELLIMLTTSNGLRKHLPNGRSQRVPRVGTITRDIVQLADGKRCAISVGGMASKLEAARAVTEHGISVVIADGRKSGILNRIMAGDDTGTLLEPGRCDIMQGRKRWIAFFHKPSGTLLVDEGARRAMVKHGKSLLPVGIKAVEGTFGVGAAVNIADENRALIARGLAGYSSRDIQKIMGKRTGEIAAILGEEGYEEVVHRDNMALLRS